MKFLIRKAPLVLLRKVKHLFLLLVRVSKFEKLIGLEIS
jgi:hypothetical protein